jgi:glutamate-1-semialdehyde 2,1-aminomutase
MLDRTISQDLQTVLEAAKQRYAKSNPKSLAAQQSASKWMPGGNTRTVVHYEPFPLYVERASGQHIYDLDGHAYVDFLGEFTAGLFGHSHPKIAASISRALQGGISLGAQNPHEQKLARVLCERFPAMELVRFANSGTEANLMALSASRAFTGRDKIAVFSGAYHGGGLTFVSGPGAMNIPFDFIEARYNDLDATRSLLLEHGKALAAVIVEPMASSGGCIPARPEFLAMLREETEKLGIVLIFDEVVTSRLAPRGVHHALGIKPDLVTLGKYIAGGMSFGAFGGRSEIMQRFDPSRKDAWPHAGTFNNNVISMAAGYTAMTDVFTPEAAHSLNACGEQLRAELNELSRDQGYAMQFTGLGASMNVHMMTGRVERPADVSSGNMALRDLFFFDLVSQGIYIARRGMINVSLVIEKEDLERLLAAVKGFVRTYGNLLAKTRGGD